MCRISQLHWPPQFPDPQPLTSLSSSDMEMEMGQETQAMWHKTARLKVPAVVQYIEVGVPPVY